MMLCHLATGILLTTTVTLGQATNSTVVINEFVTINDSGLRDKDGDFSDWLELHNYGTETVDLTGAALTDIRKRLAKWKFPETKIKPGQYLVVVMSGKDRRYGDKTLHANFALRGKGDYLGLIASDSETVIDEFAAKYPDQKKHRLWHPPRPSAWPSGKPEARFSRPTPGKANARPLAGMVKPVNFSEKRSWHEQSFKLALSTKTGVATIRYTLDGTRPTLKYGYAYESPVNIAKTTTLRAAAFKKGHKSSAPSSRTFLFLNDIVKQSPDGLPPDYFPFTWGDNKVDYGMDQRIVNDPHYAKDLVKGFHSSIVFAGNKSRPPA